MNSRCITRTLAVSAAAALGIALTACSGGSEDAADSGIDPSTATNLDAFGGMDGLIEAAQVEGELNVIALADNWVNYGEMISEFEARCDITVNSASPDASSAEEIQAAKNLAGQDTAPDVFDLGAAVAVENIDVLAPYRPSHSRTLRRRTARRPCCMASTSHSSRESMSASSAPPAAVRPPRCAASLASNRSHPVGFSSVTTM